MAEIKKRRKSKLSTAAKKPPGWLSDREYLRIFSRVPRLCVDLAILGPGGLLLGWRSHDPSPNTWNLPGGRVRFRETVTKAAQRIARTELGVGLRGIRVLGVMEFLNEVDRGTPIHSVSVVVSASLAGKLKPNGRTARFRHVPRSFYPVHRRFALVHGLIRPGPHSAR